jgi:hypothetical protein
MTWVLAIWAGAAAAVAVPLYFVVRALVPILVNLLSTDLAGWLWKQARILDYRGPDELDPLKQPLSEELAEREGRPLAAFSYAFLRRRRDHLDLPLSPTVRRAVAIGRSTNDIARQWMPVGIGGLVLTLEFPALLLVALAADSSGTVLAGVALALGIIIAIDAGPLSLATPAARFEHDRRAAMSLYAVCVGVVSCMLLLAVWSGLLGNPLGVPQATWDATLDMLKGLALAPVLVAVRRLFHGYLIAARRTGWIVPATLARTMTSVVLAALLSVILDLGATGIGIALTIGVFVEASLVALFDGRSRLRHLAAAHIRDLPVIARLHLPLTFSMLLSLAPASAILAALALTDDASNALGAWLAVFVGPLLIAGTARGLESIAADRRGDGDSDHEAGTEALEEVTHRGPDDRDVAMFVFASVFGAVSMVGWLAFATLAGIALPLAAVLAPFPLLCVMRELLRGKLVARGLAPHTLVGFVAGSLPLLFTLTVALILNADPVAAAALAVSAGAITEAAALWVSLRSTASKLPPADPPDRSKVAA